MAVKSKVLLISFLALVLGVAGAVQVLAQDGDIEDGRQLFGEYCAVCHGYDGQGRVGADLTGWFASIDPQAFVRSMITTGAGDTMPAFAQSQGGPLTEQQINDIAAYILSWRERVAPAPTPTLVPVTPIPTIPGLSGDPAQGAQVYARNCRVCHGPQGEGGLGANLSRPISAAEPAAFLRQTISRGVAGSPMPAWQGVLSGSEIEDTVAYILSWQRQPAAPGTGEAGAQTSFSWLIAALFVILLLVVLIWLVTRFSRRGSGQEE
jgi:cytochrome c oxidase cbb3-type subunit 3